mgnify:CR=1 FL=1
MVSFRGMLIDYTRCLANLFKIKHRLTVSFKLKSFKKSGINLLTSSEVISSDTKGKGVKVQVKSSGQISELDADIVISAVGIKSNIENIGLEDVGIATDNDKIMVNDFYQTNLPGYYAIGDVSRGQSLAHVASAEGILCVENI